jgi:hypothetical protein
MVLLHVLHDGDWLTEEFGNPLLAFEHFGFGVFVRHWFLLVYTGAAYKYASREQELACDDKMKQRGHRKQPRSMAQDQCRTSSSLLGRDDIQIQSPQESRSVP